MHTVWIYHRQFYSKFWPIQEMASTWTLKLMEKKTPQMVNADMCMYKCCRQANGQAYKNSNLLQQTKIHCTNEAPSNINELLDIYQAMH